MQNGESLFYLLLSIAVMIAQCVLGMADWYVLVSQWLLAGVLAASIVTSIRMYRIYVLNTHGLTYAIWAMIASVLNLCSIHLAGSMSWWLQDLLIVGFSSLFLLNIGSWLLGDSPGRFLLCGMLLGLCTLAYPHALFWLILLIWLLVYLRNFTWRNVWSIVSGTVLMVWINYCILLFASDSADSYLASFASLITWSMPDELIRQSEMVMTPWLLISFSGITLLVNVIGGMLSNLVSSLRTHATMLSTVMANAALIVFALIDPASVSLYLCLASVIGAMHYSLVVSNVNVPMMRWWLVVVIVVYIVLGFGELAMNYLLTL